MANNVIDNASSRVAAAMIFGFFLLQIPKNILHEGPQSMKVMLQATRVRQVASN